MLDEEHRDFARNSLDELAHALALGRGQSGERLVEQQQPRRGRERQPHVEKPLPAVGELAGCGTLDAR